MLRYEKLLFFLWPLPLLIFWVVIFDFRVFYSGQLDSTDIFNYIYFGAGTIVYIGHWISVIAYYPESRKDYYQSWMGSPTPLLSFRGILLSLFMSLGFGAIVLPWIIIDTVRGWIVSRKN